MFMTIKVAIVGVGNCSSALVQGTNYYRNASEDEDVPGLLHVNMGGYHPRDLEFVAAFDVDATKVGRDLSEAIFAYPNNTRKFSEVPRLGVEVQKGPVMDGLGKYLKGYVKESEAEPVDVAEELKASGAEVVVNYLPVGSEQAVRWYAEQAIKARCAFVNCMPVFIASDPAWQKRFAEKGLPVSGDDVMSQIGATVLHKALAKLMVDRGVKITESYQLNIGGDTDFLNMLEEARLISKRISKTSAVQAMVPYDVPLRIGPSDYVPFLDNKKICYVYLKGEYFGGTPVQIDVKLDVWDSPNSGGVVIDAVRASKIALDRGVSGPLISPSAFCFKHPPEQMPYEVAKRRFEEFVEGRRER
ncbi:MAG: inositol-3-phosphate synthase [Candidatus Verstraetearchaeota archaeon]|nr:inositol-3-phosphate synthase [Candidatus Verstraetearchaeota archaeon]